MMLVGCSHRVSGGCKSGRRAITAPRRMRCRSRLLRHAPSAGAVGSSRPSFWWRGRDRRARRLAGAADRSRPPTTIPSGQIEVALGASYFRNRRFPPFTPPGFIHSQNLTTVPEIGLRIGAGSMVEIQASYEFIDLDERHHRRPTTNVRRRRRAPVHQGLRAARARAGSRRWACASAPSCPTPARERPARHRRDRLLHPGAGLEALRRRSPRTSTSASPSSAIPGWRPRQRERPGRSLHLRGRAGLAVARRSTPPASGACASSPRSPARPARASTTTATRCAPGCRSATAAARSTPAPAPG